MGAGEGPWGRGGAGRTWRQRLQAAMAQRRAASDSAFALRSLQHRCKSAADSQPSRQLAAAAIGSGGQAAVRQLVGLPPTHQHSKGVLTEQPNACCFGEAG